MSRIGKKPITIPEGVQVKIQNNSFFCKGPKGDLSLSISPKLKIIKKDNQIVIERISDKAVLPFWGTVRVLIQNALLGVKEGYQKQLEIIGVGFRAQVSGKKLVLNVGFSHPLEIQAPKNIDFKVQKNIIIVSGIDKQAVGEMAAKIRALKVPEPYKGKGIRFVGEHVRKKAGKKAVATTAGAV